MKIKKQISGNDQAVPSLVSLLRRYLGIISLLVIFTVIASALTVAVPKIIARAIDAYASGGFSIKSLAIEFLAVTVLIFIFTYLQNIAQVFASEKAARDLRNEIIAKISVEPFSYIANATPAALLTNLTSDVDAVKVFISMVVSSVVSSAFLIIAIAVLLILTDWKLALIVLAIMPAIGAAFFFVLARVRKLFVKSQEAIDWLNKVISESIFGSALIRILNSEEPEFKKFTAANAEAKQISLKILGLFSGLIPIVVFLTNIATLAIVVFGGRYVIRGEISLGNFTAFNAYLAILIFPIMIIGFMSTLIAQAQASYGRIYKVLSAPVEKKTGGITAKIKGDLEVKNLTINFGERAALKGVSFFVKAGSRTAVIGPTAAGKTQLLYALTGLVAPSFGEIILDGRNINEYDKESLHSQVGFVFQDSVMFNLSLRENIAFNAVAPEENIQKAVKTAELADFVEALPQKLTTLVSERGTSLSGGQKQRIMLARALALNPSVLLLDDFTARVDAATERKILKNIAANYPNLTLISVTQKISSIEHYDKIILLMEGELVATGTHDELLATSPEYVQIFESQKSTNEYELNKEK